MNLPAGIFPTDDSIEFFRSPIDAEKCFALTRGRVWRVKDLPADIKAMVITDIDAHPAKLRQLVAMGYAGDDLLEKYCSCVYGLFDDKPDYADGKFIHSEYVQCPVRATCPGNGILCNLLTVGQGKALTDRQTDILAHIGRRRLNKEIAGDLNISPETVKIHVKNIQLKAGLMNKKDLVWLAHQKQLV
ncbi:LuxR C-terminal-related transcriptional regulator [Mucilaginibacter sp.]|uniref:response regulator transcription factor n=1 Tax=Mucilaginibacter sp. TaxID=1882438 RepID=UPI0025DC6915|nr:LuxR C-terminal-related transcriptional regulator [Mucilaginibacter sp.]